MGREIVRGRPGPARQGRGGFSKDSRDIQLAPDEEAKDWQEVRAGLDLDEDKVAQARAYHDALTRAYQLSEVRRDLGLTQVEVAKRMGVSQARVSAIERGRVSSAEVDTLRAYVAALGGEVEVIARFGDKSLRVA
jgi:DNA-binding XRE family transcriptional regulator